MRSCLNCRIEVKQVALTQTHWVAVGKTVVSLLLLTGREMLDAVARRTEPPEIVTAGKFLIPLSCLFFRTSPSPP
jgi:hypothetical protein